MFDDDDWLGGGHQPPYIPILILLLTLCVSGWASCTWYSTTANGCNTACDGGMPDCSKCHPAYVSQCNNLANNVTCPSSYPYDAGGEMTCTSVPGYKRYCCTTECDAEQQRCENEGGTWIPSDDPNECGKCDNCEAVKADCQLQGGVWVDSAGYGECDGYCKQIKCDSTALKKAKEDCDKLGAENDFELNDATCEIAGICNLCTGDAYKKKVQELKEKCCDAGKAPDTIKCVMKDINSLQNSYANLSGDGCINVEVRITSNGETYREGCDDPPDGSSDSHNNSSSSTNENSSSSDDENFSSSDENGPNSSTGNNEDGPTDWRDSLHKIIVNTDGIWSEQIDISSYLFDIKTCLEAGTCGTGKDYEGQLYEIRDTIHNSNSLLKRISEIDFSPNVTVNGGFTSEKYTGLIDEIGAVTTAITDSNTFHNQKLKEIVEGLKSIGYDTLAHGLDSLRNETLNQILDGIEGIGNDTTAHRLDSVRNGILDGMDSNLYSLDSTFKYWGDSSNWNFDSSGWGSTNDSVRAYTDSLTKSFEFFGEDGCDTTGGRKCDGMYIGSHGLDSARKGLVGSYKSLKDSMVNSAYNDSLKAWANLFKSSQLSGEGSASCPSVLTRDFTIDFGTIGGSVSIGNFGEYLCKPIFGSQTPWSLARVLLRAIVAISCMWFLFRCATGFNGNGGGDDD